MRGVGVCSLQRSASCKLPHESVKRGSGRWMEAGEEGKRRVTLYRDMFFVGTLHKWHLSPDYP